MSELEPLPIIPERATPTQQDLEHLGQLIMTAATSVNLVEAATNHEQYSTNPNVFGEPGTGFLFAEGDVPTASDRIYRQVGVEAVQDLATVGVVRNGATAQGLEHPRWGHSVFWNRGEDGKATITGGRVVLEAPAAAGATGWVTADKLTGIHVQTPDGLTKNILKP